MTRAELDAAFETYYDQLLGYCRLRQFGNPEGVLHEAFLSAVKAAPGFHPVNDRNVYNWLRQHCYYRGVEAYRKEHRSAGGEIVSTTLMRWTDREQARFLPPVEPDVDWNRMQTEQWRERVGAVMPLLADSYAVPLTLRMEGLSLPDIAAAVGRPVGSIKATIYRAKIYVRRHLGIDATAPLR